MVAVVTALGAGACSNEEASGGSDDSKKKGTSSAAAHAPKTLTEAQLKAVAFTEERAIARAKYLKVEPVWAPEFAAEADGVKAYRFTVRSVKEKSELYDYLTVVRSGSTNLAFRGGTIGTMDMGGIPQDVMTAQRAKFRAS
ncbi:hypothetical protein GCM10018966_051480 [Streptomyces yanii]